MSSIFEVYVVPGSRRPGPDGYHAGLPRLRVSSPPERGKANREVERRLSGALRCRVVVERGGTGRRKVVRAEVGAGALERLLREAFGPKIG